MVEATKKLNEKLEELTNLLVRDTSIESIAEMSDTDLKVRRTACGLVKEIECVMLKQATIIESQNNKIDELLKLVKTLTQK